MQDNCKKKMRILIIANSRFKGGTSGGDRIYESFKKYWPGCSFRVWTMLDIDYKPFALCYLHRVIIACIIALFEPHRCDLVYSASDFLPDSLPAFILKLRKKGKWVAGFYLKAFKSNRLHYLSQKLVKKIIDKFADMVIVTNKTMYPIFPNKKKTWINGGIDMELSGLSDRKKVFDAVFVGRIHPSKGIDELLNIWIKVRNKKKDARLAIIGDGDLGTEYIRNRIWCDNFGITLFGHMGDERYAIYKQSEFVIYPVPPKYDHFSMSPVEAMACGCKLVCFNTDVIKEINPPRLSVQQYLDGEDIIDIERKSVEWASQFDYKKQSLRVYQDIERSLGL